VTQRERWQALQAHLSAARAFIDAGDRRQALAEVNAALALDPDFLAAQSLRDRVLKESNGAPPARRAAPNLTAAALATAPSAMAAPAIAAPVPTIPTTLPVPSAPAVTVAPSVLVAPAVTMPVAAQLPVLPAPAVTPAVPAAPALTMPVVAPLPDPRAAQPLVSAEGYARFEARAKRRRVDRRIEAAYAALERRKLHEAASALDEIIALDPNLPELAGLTAEFDELRKAIATPHRGPWLTAAAVFIVVVLGASWRHDVVATLLVSYPVHTDVPLVAPPTPALLPAAPLPEEPAAVATAGVRDVQDMIEEPDPTPVARPRPVRPPTVPAVLRTPVASERPPSTPVPPLPPPDVAVPAVIAPTQPATVAMAPPPPLVQPTAPPAPSRAATPAASSSPAPVPFVPPPADDENLVKQTLQRYRHAYEGLDAQSAHAVWPAVNQAALARAFDGLASQAITFDQCDVQVRGAVASATCRGTARYVPKIGNRDPRVEPRVWNFGLKKDGGEWKIDSARAGR
jgi:hypothetical protein